MDDDLVILDAFVFLEVADWGLEGYGIDGVGVELWLGVLVLLVRFPHRLL